MVVILACLSLILTAGGGAMALYGADLIRSESGLALTQSGITMLSAGLVLAGLTTAVSELRRMRRLMELEEPVAPLVTAHVMPSSSPAAVPPASPAGPGPSIAPPAATPVPAPAPVSLEPTFDVPKPETVPVALEMDRPAFPVSSARPPLPPMPEVKRMPGSGIPAEAKAGLVGIHASRGGRITGQSPAAKPDDGTHDKEIPDGGGTPAVADETRSGTSPVASAPPDAPGGADGHVGMVDAAFPEPAIVPGERKMLATYNSGGITYFMFSDGSIEADMKGGRTRFTSMDELRGYIDTGKVGVLVQPAAALDAN